MKNKTLATWLALIGGPLGLHRFYLHGPRDAWAWMLPVPSLLGLYGIWRARAQGVDDVMSWALIPLLGFTASGCALAAILYGLRSTQQWNLRFNPQLQADASAGSTNGLTVVGLVLAVFLGTIMLMASLAFSFQRLFEWQTL